MVAALIMLAAAAVESRSRADEPALGSDGQALRAVEFDGVRLGAATIAEVREAWGEPKEASQRDGEMRHVYSREPFKRLEVAFRKDKVHSIAITLAEPLPAKAVAEQLGLKTNPATLHDEVGKPVGIVYPERGATLRLTSRDKGRAADSGSPVAYQVLLGEINAKAFVLRAEEQCTREEARALVDLEQALALDEKQHRAFWLRARVLVNLGRLAWALDSVDRAIELAPKQPEYLLTRARVLANLCRFDEAASEIERAIALSQARSEVKALALAQSGQLAAAGPHRDFKRSVELAQQAIRTAEPLARNSRFAVRRAAREALIEGHLVAAHGVAWGRWKSKPDAVALWLTKAEALVEESVESLRLDPDWMLRICSTALDASVGASGKIDPAEWAKRAQEVGQTRIDATDDPLHRHRLEWMLGLALYDALQSFQMRREFEPALEYGRLAVSFVESGREGRDEAPGDAYLLGRLYFRIGQIDAEEHGDHERAVEWYEKAIPLIECPVPVSALADVGRQGESLVAAAVSYWECGDRQRAVELTSHGAKLIEQAAEREIVPQTALTIVYSNLAFMHRSMGDLEQAERYASRAAEAVRR
jgi:tetratricopeptide (TPR) repeat protein